MSTRKTEDGPKTTDELIDELDLPDELSDELRDSLKPPKEPSFVGKMGCTILFWAIFGTLTACFVMTFGVLFPGSANLSGENAGSVIFFSILMSVVTLVIVGILYLWLSSCGQKKNAVVSFRRFQPNRHIPGEIDRLQFESNHIRV